MDDVAQRWLRPLPLTPYDSAQWLLPHKRIEHIESYVPKWKELPEDFRRETGDATKWLRIVDEFFFYGAEQIRCEMRDPTIPQADVIRHVGFVLKSFELSHEHKISAVAYLLSLWCTNITYTKRPPSDPMIE